uniref:Putative armadillo-type fold protein n=1 Tax=Helianthus annuus TaxID=4232 RepID=A0A251VK95_HELAN
MDNQKCHEQTTNSRSSKRKLDDEFIVTSSDETTQQDLASHVRAQVQILDSTVSSLEADRAIVKHSIHILSELAKNQDIVNLIVESGGVSALVQHLQAPEWKELSEPRPYEHEVEKGSAFTLGLLALKLEHQQLIVDAEALPHLITLLKRHKDGEKSRAVIRRAADAITNLAHENSIGLKIVDCNALPTLILMLQSEDVAIHYEAVGVIGNLVHSSPNIKKEVLRAGALQPVIELLSSSCLESQREAALLLGQFANGDTDCKIDIVQKGAVGPLIDMLQSPDAQVREMSTFALGRLAQAGIAHGGGIPPLLKLLDSKDDRVQHNAAFALFGLADNEYNVADFIRVGGVQKLQDGEFIFQPTRDCVAKTLKRLEEKVNERICKRSKM